MAMTHQLSLRVDDSLRAAIRARLEQLRLRSPAPEKLSEADAARSLIKEAAAMTTETNDDEQ